ncbi:unnamed protein product [Acanthoscelides obtectus]|uniref:C2H2-type domain-containing protein n=1 Tax=Acanthoscelides obtectus TaxID=200917 RepID=A0A9P0L513_ACAOB|nr:unnamed protein product [Acanthoscelides obtectus]CAK1644123.1 Zinc finger protein 711 [Acanthoscelides obtectus]
MDNLKNNRNFYEIDKPSCAKRRLHTKNRSVENDGTSMYHSQGKVETCRDQLKCSHCNYLFRSKYLLDKHLEVHNNGNDINHWCVECNTAFKKKTCLDEHIIQIHPNLITSLPPTMHACTYCDFKTIFKASLVKQTLNHPQYWSSLKMHRNKTSSSKESLDNHSIEYRHIMLQKKTYHCEICDYKTLQKRKLDSHNRNMHSSSFNIPVYSCNYCDENYNHQRSLDDHIVKIHPESSSTITSILHKCSSCSYTSTFRGNLDRHLKRCKILSNKDVSENLMCKCDCGYVTTDRNMFYRHMSTHLLTIEDIKSTICIFCNLEFKSTYFLDEHILNNHPHYIACITSQVYECIYCPYKTLKNFRFNHHIRFKHSEEESFCKSGKRVHLTYTKNTCLDEYEGYRVKTSDIHGSPK